MLSIHSLFKKRRSDQPDIRFVDAGECDSTNHYIKSMPATTDGMEPEPRLLVVHADYQTAGRGQGTNRWLSAPSENLLFSILCHPVWVPISSQFVLSEAIALALRDALSELTKDLSIKWPNDIYWKDRKISGTLIETTISKGHIQDFISGTGVNVNQQSFDPSLPNPVSLIQILGRETDRKKLLKDIATRYDAYLTDIRNGNYEKIVTNYHSYLYRGHGFHTFHDEGGDFEAAIVEVEDDGHLILRDRQDHIRSYAFKEVEFVI